MVLAKDERNRILTLIEAGQLNADDAARLLDALEGEAPRPPEPARERTLRIRTITLNPQQQQKSFIASMPVSLLKTSIRLGGYILPQLNPGLLEDLLRAVEEGRTGRLLDIQDLDQGERIEIFIE